MDLQQRMLQNLRERHKAADVRVGLLYFRSLDLSWLFHVLPPRKLFFFGILNPHS